jgi:hypothetical protein
MLTVDELCAGMERSGRYLTPRAARDWWTKGLLPPPRRRWRGRGKGSQTFWTTPRVLEQAQAADDLLSRHGHTYTALIGLWLQGFPVDLKLVRGSYLKLIDRSAPWCRRRTQRAEPEDEIGALAQQIATKLLKQESPKGIREDATNLLSEILSVFFGTGEEPETFGLAEIWQVVAPYWRDGRDKQPAYTDEQFDWFITHLQEWASLPAQRETLQRATDGDLVRARRVIHLVGGCFARLSPPNQQVEFGERRRAMLIVFGQPALPVLAKILREPLGKKIVPFLLQLAVLARTKRNSQPWIVPSGFSLERK